MALQLSAAQGVVTRCRCLNYNKWVMTSLLERCAYHEAGHSAAAIAFGIPIIQVTIDPAHPHFHRGRYYHERADFALE